MSAVYLFEAGGIQGYILEGGKLRDMVGASERVDSLARWDDDRAGGLLAAVLGVCEGMPCEISRCAGGAITVHFKNEDDLDRFRSLWTLVASLYAPGLSFSEGIASDDDDGEARAAAYRAVEDWRINDVADLLPLAPPIARRNPRTGLAASLRWTGTADEGEERDLDIVVLAKRGIVGNPSTTPESEVEAKGVEGRFSPEGRTLRWPIRLGTAVGERVKGKAFPHRGDNTWIAVVHADGNGLGEVLQGLAKAGAGVKVFRTFSRVVERATIQAARVATEKVLCRDASGVVPARPILLGGDDVTIIVRGDLALDYVQCFLEQFEDATAAEFKILTESDEFSGLKKPLPQTMTACAGVAFTKATLPFHLGEGLAGDLCKYAKVRAKALLKASDGEVGVAASNDSRGGEVPSAVAFHRVAESDLAPYSEILANDLTLKEGGNEEKLTMQPYYVGKHVPKGGPALAQLAKLKSALAHEDISVGVLRGMRETLHLDRTEADRQWRRWRDVTKERSGKAWQTFAYAYEGLMGERILGDKFPTDQHGTPLFDALNWRGVE